MNETIIKVVICALIFFLAGLFVTIASRNIIKIFIGIEIMINASLVMLFASQNLTDAILSVIYAISIPISGFCGVFIILNVYKKFRTLDINKIQKIAESNE